MAKHNDNAFREQIITNFRSQLAKQLQYGLAQGTFAACKVIHDRLTDESKTPEERINSALLFCEPIIHANDKSKDQAADKPKAGEQ